jgi:MFS transporter, DHA1 family, tetracycline resistance protein
MTRDNRLIALSLLLWGFGDGLFLYIQPLYLRELGANPVAIGSILSLAGVASVVSHIPAGYLADRFGRKQLLVWGWGLGILTALVMYLANTLEVFVFGLVTYTFTGFVIAPINAYVTEARGSQSIQRAVTLVSAGFWSGMVTSPALGGLIARAFGLRQVYGVAVIAFMLSTLVLLFLTPQPLVPPAPGQTRFGPLFRNGRFLSFLLLMFVGLSALELGMPLAPNFVAEVRGFNVSRIGLLGSINSLGVVLLNLALGQRTPRRGFMTGQILVALYLGLLLFAPGFGWLAAAYFFRAGWNLSRNMATAQVGRVVAKSEMALAYGMIETMTALTLALAPVVAGVLYQRSPALPFQTSLGLIAVTLPLVWIFAPRRDAHTPIREPVSAVDIQQIGD